MVKRIVALVHVLKRAGRSSAHAGRRVVPVAMAALVVLAFTGVVLGRSHQPPANTSVADATDAPTATDVPTPTDVPTATPTVVPTDTPQPTATLAPPPTATPATHYPYWILQADGQTIIAQTQMVACPGKKDYTPYTAGELTFQVAFAVNLPPNATVTWHWNRFDGSTPGQPEDVIVPEQEASFTVGPYDTRPERISASDSLGLELDDLSGKTPRWGDQFVLDTVNGHPVSPSFTSPILHVATGC